MISAHDVNMPLGRETDQSVLIAFAIAGFEFLEFGDDIWPVVTESNGESGERRERKDGHRVVPNGGILVGMGVQRV